MVTEEELQSMSPEEIAELQKKNCIFCKIINGEVPGKKVYEDNHIIAILDIRPATEGHVLVLPKEHYPILPVVPDEVKKHMFRKTKDLCKAIRKAAPAQGTTVFMANGAVAGQQSPHFLYHIVPRGKNDGLDAFNIPEKEISQAELLEALRQNLGNMMKGYLAREGKLPDQGVGQESRNQLAMVLEQNPQLKQALMENPEEFEKAISQNPQLQKFFQGVDVKQLAANLKEIEQKGRVTKPEKDNEGEEKPEQEEKTDENESGEQSADLDKVSRLFK